MDDSPPRHSPILLSFLKLKMIMTKSHSTRWSRLLNTLQIRNDYTVLPAGLQWRSNTFFILSTVAVGLFTDLFLYGLIVPVLPYMLEDRVALPKGSVQSHVSAMLAVYAGASVLCSPIIGLIADKLSSRQGPFLFGLTALMLATFLLFIGESIPVLMLARALQGVSASLVWTIGLALCLETVGPKNLGKTIGSVRACQSRIRRHESSANVQGRFSVWSVSATSQPPSLAAFCTRRRAMRESSPSE